MSKKQVIAASDVDTATQEVIARQALLYTQDEAERIAEAFERRLCQIVEFKVKAVLDVLGG